MYTRNPDYEQDLIRAADPELEEAAFEKLMYKHHGEITMAETLARNPACPYKMFVDFWSCELEAAKDNPRLDEYKSNIHWERSITRHPRTYYSKWHWNLGDKTGIHQIIYQMEHGDSELKRYLLSTENITEDIILQHVDSKSAPMRKVIAGRETVPNGVFEKLATDKAKTVRAELAANLAVPPAILAELAHDKESIVAEAARKNPSCPQDAIHKARLKEVSKPAVSDDKLSLQALLAVAYSDETAVEKLDDLAQHANACVRFMAGFNPVTPIESLQQLARDETEWVRAAVAFNPSATEDILSALLSSTHRDVRIGLASNPSLPEEFQLQLATVDDEEAQITLANLTEHVSVWEKLADGVELKKKMPAKDKTWKHFLVEALAARKTGKFSTLERGRNSRWLFIHRIAARAESCPDELLCHYAQYIFEDYAKNPKAALALLEGRNHVPKRHYQEWKVDKWMQEAYAPGHVTRYYMKEDIPKRRLQCMSNWTTQIVDTIPVVLDRDTNTRKRLATRKDLIRFEYEVLVRDEKKGVREEIAKNPNAPSDLKESLKSDKATIVSASAKTGKSGAVKGKAHLSLVNQGSATDRVRLVKKTDDPKVLAQFVDDRAASVKVEVARNRNVDEATMSKLAQDKDIKVRLAVADNCRYKSVFRELLKDPGDEVRYATASNSRWKYCDRNNENSEFPSEMLMSFMSDASEDVRSVTAKESNDQAQLAILVDDESIVVARALAKNNELPDELRLKMAKQHDDAETLSWLARYTGNVEAYLAAVQKIKSSHEEDGITANQAMLKLPEVQDALCHHPLPRVRYILAIQEPLTEYAAGVLGDEIDDQVLFARKVRRKHGL
jgi:hypothetical protein